MKRILKTRVFARWMRKANLDDGALLLAVDEMERGLVDADLGGGVYKKRVALPGKGKSGGVRTIVATNRGDRWFFIFGFAKSEKENITDGEFDFLRRYGKRLLKSTEPELEKMLAEKTIQEIRHEPTH